MVRIRQVLVATVTVVALVALGDDRGDRGVLGQ